MPCFQKDLYLYFSLLFSSLSLSLSFFLHLLFLTIQNQTHTRKEKRHLIMYPYSIIFMLQIKYFIKFYWQTSNLSSRKFLAVIIVENPFVWKRKLKRTYFSVSNILMYERNTVTTLKFYSLISQFSFNLMMSDNRFKITVSKDIYI